MLKSNQLASINLLTALTSLKDYENDDLNDNFDVDDVDNNNFKAVEQNYSENLEIDVLNDLPVQGESDEVNLDVNNSRDFEFIKLESSYSELNESNDFNFYNENVNDHDMLENFLETDHNEQNVLEPDAIKIKDANSDDEIEILESDNNVQKNAHICDICGKSYNRKTNLESHKRIAHYININYQCGLCKEIFENLELYNSHVDIHKASLKKRSHKPDWYNCKKCNRYFDGLKNIETHKRSCFIYKCHLCESYFLEVTSYTKHLKHHKRSKTCVLCNTEFKNNYQLIMHLSNNHFKQNFFQCDKCGDFYEKGNDFTLHMKLHDNASNLEKYLKCQKCSKYFIDLNHLETHDNVSHGNKKQYKCELCASEFSFSNYLEQHYKKHDNEHIYQCLTCDSTFHDTGTYLTHKKLYCTLDF